MKIFVLLVILGLIACTNESTVFRKKVQNNTNKTIKLYFFGDNHPLIYGDTIVIGANVTEEIYTYVADNSSISTIQPCAIYTDIDDTIAIEIAGGSVLTKSFYVNENWSVEQNGEQQICTFVITDADIQ